MESEVAHEFRFFRVYKDGRVERLMWATDIIPPFDDPVTGVKCKDVTISPEVSVRIFLPRIFDPNRKFPLLLYIHGGGYSFESAFSSFYGAHVKALTAESNAVVVSVEYRLAPENPIPACYDDVWAALQWVTSHCSGDGPEPWLNNYADFNRVFFGGDSGGGNMSHYLASKIGPSGLPGVRVIGAILVHPFFGGLAEDDEMWLYMCGPNNEGLEDPRLNPTPENMGRLACEKVLVFLAENDHLRQVGGAYCDKLKKSAWGGTLEIVETRGENHCFHLFNPTCENALGLIKKFASFVNQE